MIVINFQSWLDPFIIITALPAALTGIVLFLFLTHTTLSVPALMGALMCMGIATANSILVVEVYETAVKSGDVVTLTLDAFPGEMFTGTLVRKLELNRSDIQDVESRSGCR